MRLGRPTTMAPTAMVATPHYLATSAGVHALRDGGSSMDAVIAANAVLTVLYSDQTAIGGDCFFLHWDEATRAVTGFNGSGAAPLAADPEALRAQGYQAMPVRGPLTVTVPGTIDAWSQGHDRHGKLPWDRVLAPAISYARDGFPVSPRFAAVLAAEPGLITGNPALAAMFYPNGVAPGAGEILRLPQLAASLTTIAKQGRDAFYTGGIAGQIVATLQGLGGWMTADDLARHEGEWVTPLSVPYRAVDVLAIPPNSQGMTSLLELRMVQHLDLAKSAWGSGDHLHPLIEAKKLAFRVRDTKLGDPRFVKIDTGFWLSDPVINDLWGHYDPAHAGDGQVALPGDTVFLCAVDRNGNATSMIQSLYQSFGSAIVAGDTGIILQNRGTSFSLQPDVPNELQPGKRPLHTLMPSMLLRNGRLLGPIGTQGGDLQAQLHLQLITDLIDYRMEPQAAIEAPRWIAGGPGGGLPYQVILESGFPEATVADLASRGHQLTVISQWNTDAGHAQMIMVDAQRGELLGGADPRADGSAEGY